MIEESVVNGQVEFTIEGQDSVLEEGWGHSDQRDEVESVDNHWFYVDEDQENDPFAQTGVLHVSVLSTFDIVTSFQKTFAGVVGQMDVPQDAIKVRDG